MRRAWLLPAVIGCAVGVGPDPADANCTTFLDETKALAREIQVVLPSAGPVRAGQTLQAAWSRRSGRAQPRVPLYLVLTAPAQVRFAGKGFVALSVNAEAPHRLAFGRETSRAYIPLHAPAAERAGRIGITLYRAGTQSIGWALVTAGPCGEHVLFEQARSLDIAAGSPQLVVQDRFAVEQPKQRVRSRSGLHDLLVFADRYEVHEVATGAKIVDRPGIDANFSPGSRFVAARTSSDGVLEIIDLVSGTKVGEYTEHLLAWARNDSFVVAGGPAWGAISLANAIVDRDPVLDARVACHACGSWEEGQFVLDLERGFAAAVGALGAEVRDLASGQGLSNDRGGTDAGQFRQLATQYVRRTYDGSYRGLPNVWSMGEKLVLSHGYASDEAQSERQRFVARHDQASAAPSPQSVGADGRILARSLSAIVVPTQPRDPDSIFERLAAAGLPTRQPVAAKWTNITSSDSIQDSELPARNALLADVLARAPNARRVFRKQSSGCLVDGAAKPVADPDWISQAYEWKEGAASAWLIQAVCYDGSAAFVNAADLILVREAAGGGSVGSLLAALGEKALGGTVRTHESMKVAAFPSGQGRLLIASRGDGLGAVVDLAAGRRTGALLTLREPTLLQQLRLSQRGDHVVQVNSDGRFFVYGLSDGRAVLEGAHIDDEVVAFIADGQYDTSYEGAHALQVRFEGIEGLFTFSQFDPVLRRPGLVSAVMEGRTLPAPKPIAAPPTIQFELDAIAKDGRRTGSVRAASGRDLAALRFYVDGRLSGEHRVRGRTAAVSVAVPDTGGGRWVSAVAVDADGLLSQPAGIRIPGTPQARGTARLIAVGVDEYGDPKIEPLQSAKRDARNMVRALADAQGRAFAAVQTTSLLDAEVTPKAVLAAVTDAVAATGPDDTIVLFFAGHGVDGKALGQPDAGLVLATHGTRIADLAATSIRWSALADALAASKGTVVVVLDACHAGIAGSEAFATNDAVVSALLTTSGAPMIVLAGSKGRQFSQETGDGGGGRFTNAIVAAIADERGRHDRDGSGLIDLGELYAAVKTRVLEETGGAQAPWLARNALVGNMSLF